MASPSPTPEITLHTYYRSSCSARLRIALALKKLPRTDVYINLIKGGQSDPSYVAINPSATVPILTLTFSSPSSKTVKITQSIAALEYLDEAFPDTYQLLPKDAGERAKVRVLVGIVAADVQPPTNLRILNRVKKLAEAAGQDPATAAQEWARDLMSQGLQAYEALVKESAGRFSVGGRVTMADVCLVPAMWGTERFGVDLSRVPTVVRIYGELRKLDEVVQSHWQMQSDCPGSLR
jgi:maleylacetoacetate isomerase